VYYQQPGGGLVVKGRKVVQLLNVFLAATSKPGGG
jgi:hypothetical protein